MNVRIKEEKRANYKKIFIGFFFMHFFILKRGKGSQKVGAPI